MRSYPGSVPILMASPSSTPAWHNGPAPLAAPRSFVCFLALGILDYRVLGTNFKDFAVIFTQLEFGDEVFNTVELYSKWGLARLLRVPGTPDPGECSVSSAPGEEHTGAKTLGNLKLARGWKTGAGVTATLWLPLRGCSFMPRSDRDGQPRGHAAVCQMEPGPGLLTSPAGSAAEGL